MLGEGVTLAVGGVMSRLININAGCQEMGNGSIFYTLRERTMKHKRFLFSDRRLRKDMPNVPFKDSNGATIEECRRKIPDRRIDSLQAEWINEIVIR